MTNTIVLLVILSAFVSVLIGALIKSKRYRNILKIKLFRIYIRWSLFFEKFNQKIDPYEVKLSPLQEKAIKLWKLCLRDKSVELRSSIFDSVRQIDKDNVMLILKPSQDYFLLSILDFDSVRKNCYEVHIPRKMANQICNIFDGEMSKRMKDAENMKRNILGDDLDKLITQQEKILKLMQKLK